MIDEVMNMALSDNKPTTVNPTGKRARVKVLAWPCRRKLLHQRLQAFSQSPARHAAAGSVQERFVADPCHPESGRLQRRRIHGAGRGRYRHGCRHGPQAGRISAASERFYAAAS
jgi:hypothetical protein